MSGAIFNIISAENPADCQPKFVVIAVNDQKSKARSCRSRPKIQKSKLANLYTELFFSS